MGHFRPPAARNTGRLLDGLLCAGLLAVPVAGTAASVASSRHRGEAATPAPLAGKIIGIDPGHNGRNWTDPAFLNKKIWNGREWEDADYGPSTGRGFTVLEPVAVGPNNKVIKSSVRFGRDVHLAMRRHTRITISDYYGHDGYIFRNDLAGLNLTTMPKVLIECGNMNNRTDARLLTSPKVQRSIARALEAAIISFLAGH